jgi:hypothetical protein
MPLILFLFLFLNVFAADVCTDKELTDRCFLDTCLTKPQKESLVPFDSESFSKAFKEYKFSLPVSEKEQLVKFNKLINQVKIDSNEFLHTKGFDKVSGEIVGNLHDYAGVIPHLFSEQFTWVYENGVATIMMSDLESPEDEALHEKIANFFKSYIEEDYNYEDRDNRVSRPESNKFFGNVTSQMSLYFQKTNPAKAKKLKSLSESITKKASVFKEWSLLDSLFTPLEYGKMLSGKYSYIKNDLAKALMIREAAISEEEASNLEEQVKVTCKLAHFMRDKVKGRDLKKEFDLAKAEAIKGYEEKFLKNLCPEVANYLKKEMKDSTFEAVNFNQSIYPDFKGLTNALSSFKKVNNTRTYLESVAYLDEHREEFTCGSNVYKTADFFDPESEKITISLFTLGMGYKDTISHELGHWVLNKLNRFKMSPKCQDKISALQNCIAGFYQDGQRFEEDFSDWFAGVTSPIKSPFFCETAQLTPIIMSYLDPTHPNKTELYLPQSSDAHSSNLFRELHYKVIKNGPLSKNCQELLDKHPEAHPKKCGL